MDNVAEGLEYQKINFIDMLPNTMAFSPFGKFKRCSWCYNVMKDTGVNFCSEDCKVEEKEYYELRRIKRNRECAKKQRIREKLLKGKPLVRIVKGRDKDKISKRKKLYYKLNREKLIIYNRQRRKIVKQQKVALLKTMNKI